MKDHEQESEAPKSDKQAPRSMFSFAKGMAVAAHITGYIVGPLLLFGIAGWWLDQRFETSPFLLLGGILAAFITTNVLIYKRAASVVKSYTVKPEERQKENNHTNEDE